MDNGQFEIHSKVRIKGEYDLIVVGGGIAGVSAALAARRSGLSVLIIEKNIMLGGLATNGLIVFYLCALCDGYGRRGIAEELLHLSIKYGYSTLPDVWKNGPSYIDSRKRYATIFNAYAFILALDELMDQEGIDVLYDTVFSSSVMEDGWCKGLIVENKEGRVAYRCKMVVDASGDADVMERSGAECVVDGNWLSFWTYSTNLSKMQAALDRNSVYQGLKLEVLGSKLDGTNHPPGMKRFKVTDGMEVSEFVKEGRKLLLERWKLADSKAESLTTLPSMPQFRTTRRIEGYYVLSNKDKNVRFDDSIGCATEEAKPYHKFEIPYRTLITKGIRNIITAGRIISSIDAAREVTRLISPCSITGQAAGTAAKLAIELGCDVQDVAIGELQSRLYDAGVIIHFDEIEKRYPGPTSEKPDTSKQAEVNWGNSTQSAEH
jgi:hypothetical protein